ncbi:hypothetical protein [Flavobacterium araucananum]|uniref:hypothetical protein n=1 Tax=Flavobacterium araucananum TaxID=946678 RepID=UPI0013FDA78F|nr:hypothetical protein [Flavobacterium araucananum]
MAAKFIKGWIKLQLKFKSAVSGWLWLDRNLSLWRNTYKWHGAEILQNIEFLKW